MGFIRRRTRRRTMLVAGGAAYAAGKAAGREKEEEHAEEAPPAPTGEAGGSEADELQRLADLHASGALTDEEFAEAKAKILGS